MNVDPRTLARREVHALINGLVAPRPIAWVSSVAADGTRNLAPFSFFNAFSTSPPTIAIGPGSRQGVPKDTQANIRASGEFTISMVGRELAEKANLSSAEVPADVDEWTFAGVTPVASVDVTPERVAESPASFECRVHQVVDLGLAGTATNALIIARIVRIHVDDALLDGYAPDPDRLDLVGRAGGDLWVSTRKRFELARPSSELSTVLDSPVPESATRD